MILRWTLGSKKIIKNLGKLAQLQSVLLVAYQKNVGHKDFFDNLFSSVELVESLKEDGIYFVGKIHANMLQGAQKILKCKQELEKLERGAYDFCVDSN